MIFIFVIPVLLALGLLAWSLAGIVADIRNSRRISIKYCLGLAASLTVLEAAFCLAMTVAAGLSHSEAAKDQADVICVVSFLLVVVCPFVGLLLYRRRQPPGQTPPKNP